MMKKRVSERRKKELERELARIVDLIIKHYSPIKIILFGSLASGKCHKWSDIDLVIIKNTDKRFLDRMKELDELVDSDEAVNFFVYTEKEIEQFIKEENYFYLDEIVKKGKVLYEKTE